MIELLVVIAIIAILAAILFPVFAKAREKARQASCQSNQKQVMLGVLQYVQDYDERFPQLFTGGGSTATNVLWNQMVQPYVKSTDVFVCPSDTNRAAGVTGWADPNPASYIKPFRSSYIVNVATGLNSTSISVAQIQAPATTVYMCDGGTQGSTTAPFVTGTVKPRAWILQDPTTNNNGTCCSAEVSTTNGDWAAPHARHSEMANVGFMDGHVKALKNDRWYYGNTPWLDYTRGGS